MKKLITITTILFFVAIHVSAQENHNAKVVLFRTFNPFGCAVGYNVFQDTTKITRLRAKSFEVANLEAKPTRLWAKTEARRYVDIDLKPDHIYFIRGKLSLGWFVGQPRLETLTVQEFKDLVSRKKYLQKQLKKLGFDSVEDFLKPYQVTAFTGL